jgi:ferredoxin
MTKSIGLRGQKMKVTVDEDRCAGHGMCLTLCPEVFEMTDDGWAVANPGEIPADLQSAVKDAIANCPEQAITEMNS